MDIHGIRQVSEKWLAVYLWLHVPIIGVTAFVTGSVAWQALTIAALAVSILSSVSRRLTPNSLASRVTVSVGLMCMVSLLVYALMGHAWQIDMHMYFFAALAIVTAFCCWRTMLIAAGVVAVHHLVLNFAYPAAVFPEAAFLRVVLHAVIVILQTAVLGLACWRLELTLFEANESLILAQNAQRDLVAANEVRERMEKEMAAARKLEMTTFASRFEGGVGQVVDNLSSAALEMDEISSTMVSAVTDVSSRSQAAADAARYASTYVDAVASAADQLGAAISEISKQATRSVDISAEAEAKAAHVNATIQSLAEAASRIDEVVRLIHEIAGQTNLLALNATIEAARAGELGKGFNVVAGEVKALANQTARATDEIGAHVSSVQQITNQAVIAIGDIVNIIDEMSTIGAAIAAAVEEQHAATQEIAGSVQAASDRTNEVAANINSVNTSTAEANTAASRVMRRADGLADTSNELKQEVEEFLARVRAA